MFSAFRKLWNDDRGNVLILGGAALPILIGAAGLATDTIQWALWKRQLQRAADSAAIAGVYDRVNNDSTEGTEEVVNHDLTLNHHTGIDLLAGFPEVSFPADAGDLTDQVQVELEVQRTLPFSSLFMDSAPTIRVLARAASTPGTDEYCVVSLENTTNSGILASGSAEIIMDCGMITNSLSSNAAAAQGSARVTATVIAAAGGIQQSSNWNVGNYDPYTPAEEDPYATLTPDEADRGPNNCAGTVTITGSNGSGSNWTPNCYRGINIQPNRTANLAPGTYFINGGSVNIQGTLNATGATIVLSNTNPAANATIGTFDMNAQGTLNMTAPTTGKWAGMAIYQDRRATPPTGNISASSPNKINGGSTGAITGVVYFPNQQLTYNGGGNTTASCTQFVVRRVIFTGNANTNIRGECEAAGMPPIVGGRRVRLVA
ncbi:MAG TPA: pilus assembly protein TadG-related protein [Sphingomicrobium sp.]|nr:pilus assembly protein TadG-related protein [Sphingomicrobium sp.]